MNAAPIYPRAEKAAAEVSPVMLAQALDHIEKTAAASRTSTRRLRWIERRAQMALDGQAYSDASFDLPKDAGPNTAEKNARRIAYLLSAIHRIKELGVGPSAMQVIDEALGIAEAQSYPAHALPAGQTVALDAIEKDESVAVSFTQFEARCTSTEKEPS